MNKPLGYTISIIGLIILFTTIIPQLNTFIQETLNIPLDKIPELYLTIAGVIIIIIGLSLITLKPRKHPKGKQKEKEVPIYKDKEIVGYRRR